MLAVRREEIIWRRCVFQQHAGGLFGRICGRYPNDRMSGTRGGDWP